ncbi:MAG: hypothetical protein J0G30_00220, partial [Actinomycetales bacterium]|nr:hypothetical protein [Actinomycetales bacterium]
MTRRGGDDPAVAVDPLPLELVGYRVLRRLARGSHAVRYLGSAGPEADPVVLEAVEPSARADGLRRARALEEATVAAGAAHIERLLDLGEGEGPVLVTEWFPRGDLPGLLGARAALGCGAAAVLAALLGMAAAVETVKPEWRDPEYGHRLNQLRALRSAHPGRPLVVAVGSSRTQMGVSPAAMGFADAPGAPLVFNFGQSGAGPLRMDLTVERLAAEGIVPDVLLVEFFPAALAHDGPAEEQLKATTARLSWGDLRRLEPYTTDRAALRRRWAGGRFASWHSLRLVLMSHWQPNWLPWHDRLAFQWEMTDPFGFSPYPQEDVSDADRARGIARVREQYAGLMSDYRVGPMSDRV